MEEILRTVSYDQYIDIPILGETAKVIFSEKAWNFLQNLMLESSTLDAERGCFFVGRINQDSNTDEIVYYFDYHTSQFICEDAIYKNGSVYATDENYEQLNNRISDYRIAKITPAVMHFHTHIKRGFYESFSDQDLKSYAEMCRNRGVSAFGMLATPTRNEKDKYALAIVCALKMTTIGNRTCADFYSVPNIYYCSGIDIHKIGTSPKTDVNRKTASSETSRSDRIVRNYRANVGMNAVPITTVNPTKEMDEVVGYIDANQTLCFPYENRSYVFGTIEPIFTKEENKKS